MLLNGSEILLECFIEQGVDTVFGYPGGKVLNIYDALYKYKDKITHYLTSHEQSAAHAADGYARVSGKVGVCIATSGPGATNLVTGIATAYMDSVPMVAITGNVPLSLLGKDTFQEVDIAGITMPITKHNYIVKDVTELAGILRKAFYIAKEGRPGPVLVDITQDVTANKCEFEPMKLVEINLRTEKITDADLHKAAEMINQSKKPMIFAGGGVVISESSSELTELAEKIDAPVCLSIMGLGGFPSEHPAYTGMIGMHGSKASNTAVTECDLLIAVGVRFSDRVTSDVRKFAKGAKILHFDVDAAEINKNVMTDCAVTGDLKPVLAKINGLVEKASHPEWMDYIGKLKKDFPLPRTDGDTLKPQYIMEKISEITNGDAVYVTEVGQHQMWAAQYIKYKNPRSFISSGGLGTMGYGFGAAIGACVANPGKTVFNIAGDGCFRMNNIELATVAEYNIPVIIVIINNHTLGMVRQWQTLFYGSRYSHTGLGSRQIDFIKLADAYGVAAFSITKPDEAESVIKKAISLKAPVVINCEVDIDEKVFPMVPTGAGISELILD